mmetsp:Transcript_20414/g.47617  ORF Transcript_20414/g.47617 Transcript_20414/m.47617 type:complete len:262 (+) Transcript_20414:1668-2453(+)
MHLGNAGQEVLAVLRHGCHELFQRIASRSAQKPLSWHSKRFASNSRSGFIHEVYFVGSVLCNLDGHGVLHSAGLTRAHRLLHDIVATEEIRPQGTLPFHFNLATRLGEEGFGEPTLRGLRDLDASWNGSALHPAGRVHGIAEELVARFVQANDPCTDLATVQPNADVELQRLLSEDCRKPLASDALRSHHIRGTHPQNTRLRSKRKMSRHICMVCYWLWTTSDCHVNVSHRLDLVHLQEVAEAIQLLEHLVKHLHGLFRRK